MISKKNLTTVERWFKWSLNFVIAYQFPEAKDFDLRIFYKILEYETLLDSSNMTEKEWCKIAEDIMVRNFTLM